MWCLCRGSEWFCGNFRWYFSYLYLVQVQEIEGELSSRKQEEAKRRRDIQEIREQITALQQELDNLDETVDYQVIENISHR